MPFKGENGLLKSKIKKIRGHTFQTDTFTDFNDNDKPASRDIPMTLSYINGFMRGAKKN